MARVSSSSGLGLGQVGKSPSGMHWGEGDEIDKPEVSDGLGL